MLNLHNISIVVIVIPTREYLSGFYDYLLNVSIFSYNVLDVTRLLFGSEENAKKNLTVTVVLSNRQT